MLFDCNTLSAIFPIAFFSSFFVLGILMNQCGSSYLTWFHPLEPKRAWSHWTEERSDELAAYVCFFEISVAHAHALRRSAESVEKPWLGWIKSSLCIVRFSVWNQSTNTQEWQVISMVVLMPISHVLASLVVSLWVNSFVSWWFDPSHFLSISLLAPLWVGF